ncbi:unnamed protein product [Didymodactylos carnosus]|uniref:Uncharacterized protein n=1 Tax=Didymodactylos carnosus TaxID=1234261 RepID=A0A8S2F3W8_9BILA|nr:unnamed protein product [Didymodactylos carnosus]CAF4146949.1 unnamed protein product [Didymodactylos carnosus]
MLSCIPYIVDDERNVGQYSDHVSVWLDAHIGKPENNRDLKALFRKITQPLEILSEGEEDIDEPMMLDVNILKSLQETVYRLELFDNADICLEFIHANRDKQIFFVSSGSMGRLIVPKIFELPQLQSIFIFCGDISKNSVWAMDYCEKISAMVIHQDDLLVHLTKCIAQYLESKGNGYMENDQTLRAKNCFAWSKKLLLRAEKYGHTRLPNDVKKIEEKILSAETGQQSSMDYQ